MSFFASLFLPKPIVRSATRGQAEREHSLTQIINICSDFQQWNTTTHGQTELEKSHKLEKKLPNLIHNQCSMTRAHGHKYLLVKQNMFLLRYGELVTKRNSLGGMGNAFQQ